MDVRSDNDFVVCWKGSGEKEIGDALKRLDPNLFLDKEIDYRGGPVFYVVKHYIGSAQPPIVVLEWKEDNGHPKPLCHALVEQVKRQEGRMDGAVRGMVERLAAKKERDRELAREEQRESTAAHIERLKAAEGRTLPPYWRPRRFGAR